MAGKTYAHASWPHRNTVLADGLCGLFGSFLFGAVWLHLTCLWNIFFDIVIIYEERRSMEHEL